MPLATPAELATYLQQDVDTASATLALSLVETEVLAAADVAAGDVPAWVKGIVLAAAARLYDNPTGIQSETIDDYTRRYVDAAQTGLLTAAEIERLARISAPSLGSAFVVGLGG
jgi:hypothetical protein